MDSPKSPSIDLDRLVIHDFSSIESESFKKDIVIPYFKDIYRDLASRSDKKSSGINKVTMIDYWQLPGILAERFFSLLDDNNDSYIDLKEFVYVLFKIYYSDFDEQVKLVFDIYDFDRDGYITKEDVRIILSYIPILRDKDVDERDKEGSFSQDGGGHDEYFTRVRIQEEIAELVELVFKDKEKIDLKEFQEINETISSDMLVTVLGLLRNKLPCSENFYHFQEDFFKNNKKEDTFSDFSSQASEVRTKSIPSPTVLKSLSPLARQASNREGMSTGAMSQLRKIAKQDSDKEIPRWQLFGGFAQSHAIASCTSGDARMGHWPDQKLEHSRLVSIATESGQQNCQTDWRQRRWSSGGRQHLHQLVQSP